MTISTGVIRALQVLLAGRNPQPELGAEVNTPDAIPTLATDGYELVTSTRRPIYTWCGVRLGTATAVSYELWVYLVSASGSGAWYAVPHTARAEVGTSEIDRYPLSGARRVFVRITATDGTVNPVYAPCVEE